MNLILLESPDTCQHWPLHDDRAQHVVKILRMAAGDSFFVGLPNGPRGKATIHAVSTESMHVEIQWDDTTPSASPINLIVGLPRPQTARRVLFEAAVFGAQRLLFFLSERGEASYASSALWRSDEWKRHLRQGAEQAFSTTIPEVFHFDSLKAALEAVEGPEHWSPIALDVYEATCPLSGALEDASGAILALGSERGWSPSERDTLRESDYTLAGLGERVLKTETACVAAMAVALAQLGE